jgi:uroporphyrinogen decarboxylase
MQAERLRLQNHLWILPDDLAVPKGYNLFLEIDLMTSHPHSHIGMSGKELLFSVLRHEEAPAVPWVPFAGVHAGKLKGYTGRQILTDGDKLLEALLAVNQVYAPDGQPVLFDLQIEAEILGCKLLWADYAPPAVASHPLADLLEVPTTLPEKTDGRLSLVLDVMRQMKVRVGAETALYGLVTGPFTLASHLRGTDIFLDSVDHEDFLHELMAYAACVCQRMSDLYIDAGMDVIAVVDPVVSQVSARYFKSFLADDFTKVFDHIRQRGVFSSFFVCGDATKNIEVMCQTVPDSISIDENIDMVAAKAITDHYNITLGGNIPLTTRMLLGNQQDNMQYVVELLDKVSHRNLVISPGCDMPYDVPLENTIAVMQAVREPESALALLANYKAAEVDTSGVVLPDYSHLVVPLVEVFTLDSDTCAACGYMLGAAKRAVNELDGRVDLVEYKFTQRENVARVVKLGVQHLPSLYINGQLMYSSLIPGNRELLDELHKVLND